MNDITGNLNPNFKDFFRCADREVVLRGGGHAGKTYSVADKLLLQSPRLSKTRLKVVVIRKTLPALKDTAWRILRDRAETFGLPWQENRQDNRAVVNGNMELLFRSINNQEDYIKIKSLTDVDFIWVNEITDIRESDYRIIKARLRGGKADFAQIIGDFNPIGKTNWVYKRFYEKKISGVRRFGPYTVYHNPWATKPEIDDIEAYREDNLQLWRVYCRGEWGELKGQVYSWPEADLPTADSGWYDEVFYGLDFGFSVNPAALVRIYRKADKYWVQEMIYQAGLTNQDLAERMREMDISPEASGYADSAEPKSIEELHRAGFNIYPSSKGRDSVRAQIDHLKGLDISVTSDSPNIKKELSGYVWKTDKDGESLNVPVKKKDHAMDAIRYGIWTHMKDRTESGFMVI